MKPLTIEQLKSLEVGDWVWITTHTNNGEYYQIGYSEQEIETNTKQSKPKDPFDDCDI